MKIKEQKPITPAMLWEKIDALMTDSVTKNLGIKDTVPEGLGSTHHPYHLLCKSHTVEALDRSSLEVLSKIEKSVSQQQTMEGNNPALKCFFRGKAAIVEAGIDAVQISKFLLTSRSFRIYLLTRESIETGLPLPTTQIRENWEGSCLYFRSKGDSQYAAG